MKRKENLSSNIRYSVLANFVTMFISTISIIIFPKILGTESYGYYQLYLFYISFAGIIHFGIVDGILLKFAGLKYDELIDSKVLNQFWILNFIQIILVIPLLIVLKFIINLGDSQFLIVIFSLICVVLTNQRSIILAILQSSNRIYEYSKLTRIDRVLYIFPAIIYLAFLGKSFTILIVLDLICRALALGYGVFLIKDDFFKKVNLRKTDFLNTIYLSKVGLSLTLSFISSQLITGIIRLCIQKKWSITEFGKISLTLSLSNMFLTFINAISATLFPHLRKIETNLYSDIYMKYRLFFVSLSFGILILFYPTTSIMNVWLPEYKDSFYYMGFLFPMFIYEAKTSLLTNTFLKTVRKEKVIFFSNMSALLASILFSILFVFLLSSIKLTVLSILFVTIIKSEISEVYLSKFLNQSTFFMRMQEYILTTIFVIINFILPFYLALLVYSLTYFIYITFDRKYRVIVNVFERKFDDA